MIPVIRLHGDLFRTEAAYRLTLEFQGMVPPRFPRVSHVALSSLSLILTFACQPREPSAEEIVGQSIERYGGDLFRDTQIRFEFRGTPFQVTHDSGRFRYERMVVDEAGAEVSEVMENEGTWTERAGSRVELTEDQIYDLETAVNSVIYFGFLPFRLDDPAVIVTDLGDAKIGGEPYHEIEVTFSQEGGGTDWDTRFVHWIHQADATLDYFAYSYSRDGGGTRFRRAINRREVGGLLIQDYENYAGDPDTSDIAELDIVFDRGDLELLSVVALESVEVSPN